MSEHELGGLGRQSWENVKLREYVEALLLEKQRALDAALAAQKEAVAKAEVATDRIAARVAADQEALRGEISERLAALRRELESATAAQKEAVLKQEQANERRFEGVNEWRAQSADRERSQIEERARLTGSFVLKEVFDAQHGTLVERLMALQSRMDRSSGRAQGSSDFRADALSVIALLVSIAVAVVLIVHG